MALADPLQAREPVHAGHPHVEEREVGLRLRDEWQHLRAVVRLRDDLEVGRVLEGVLDSRENEGVIVGDQDAHTRESLDEVSAHAVPPPGNEPEGPGPRALVVAATPGVRAGIRGLLEANGFVVTAEAADGVTAAAAAIRASPDFCVVHGGEGKDGIAALALVKTRAPATAVVLLVERADADELIDALRAGASGYILESGGPAGINPAPQAGRAGEAGGPRGVRRAAPGGVWPRGPGGGAQ